MSEEATQQVFKCFVIMPFSQTEHVHEGRKITITQEQWSHIFSCWVKKAIESFPSYKFRCERSAALPGNFVKGIVKDLYEADIVIADLTGGKSNVYYELGIRHALETGTIMITQDIAAVPSDLRSYYTFEYSYTSEHHEYDRCFAEFETRLHEKMRSIFENHNPSDNPVSDYLGGGNEHLVHVFEQERNELIFIVELLRDTLKHHFDVCEFLLTTAKDGEYPDSETTPIFDPFPFDLLLSRLVNTRWQLMPMQTLQTFNEILQCARRLFLPVFDAWHILRINPASQGVANFWDLLEAVVASRAEMGGANLDAVVEEVRKINYSVTFTPRSEEIRSRSK